MIELRGYQYRAMVHLSERETAILGDDVGVGKTFPAIHAVANILNSQPADNRYALIVLPPHLVRQWVRNIHKYAKGREDEPAFRLPVHVVGRHSLHTRELGPGWHITTYPTIQNSGRKANPSLWVVRWPVVVADEAHRLRTRKSQQFKNFKDLTYQRLFLLTGTPMENNPSDIWALLHLCDRKLFGSYWRFVDDWMRTYKDPWKTHILGLREPLVDLWNKMIDNYMLRRLINDDEVKEDINLDDPIHYDIPVQPTPSILSAHKIALEDYRIMHANLDEDILATSGGALVTKLRKFVSVPPEKVNPKMEALNQVLEDEVDEADSAIVYTWFKESAEYVYSQLQAAGYDVFLIHGDMNANVRANIVESWQQNEASILVGTIASMSEGLDLQNANVVIFYEEYYLPGQLRQAVGRVNRSGQEKPVFVYHIFLEKTVDYAVVKTARKRERTLAASLRGDENNITNSTSMALRDVIDTMLYEEYYDE